MSGGYGVCGLGVLILVVVGVLVVVVVVVVVVVDGGWGFECGVLWVVVDVVGE